MSGPDEITIKLGEKFYTPIQITVEYKQEFPPNTSVRVIDTTINVEDTDMLRRLDELVHEHMTHIRMSTGGHSHHNKIELMILKPINYGE